MKNFYKENMSCVHTKQEFSEYFPANHGQTQGCWLSPTLVEINSSMLKIGSTNCRGL